MKATSATEVEQRNMELMQTLDDAWNAQDMDTFTKRHKPDVVVTWPGKPPTHGIRAHGEESLDFFRAFPTSGSTIAPTGCSSPAATGPARSPVSGAP